ncbi:hypothetical protein FH972_021639 [Carpinus fangiana]|uniref:Zn(2)-C6 fungal-type domain-containing protein n=1 Tax=Carpinus fangiana TaxID=176857 RepID=A0A5N6KQJ6_9ROSI|nr:hypothetical protein FH972_021639 [Carpinus fangiana]
MSSSASLASRPAGKTRRRPHHKSQFGCFTCRRRRVKCSETLPACEYCSKKMIACVYPDAPGRHVVSRSASSVNTLDVAIVNGSGIAPSQDGSLTFDLSEMLLFHHFVFHAVPLAPAGSEHDSRTLAQSQARNLQHRASAIKGLSQMLQVQPKTIETNDALLATCYLLAAQTVYLPDGIYDYLTLVRGCGIIIQYVKSADQRSRFRYLDQNNADTAEDFKATRCKGQEEILEINVGLLDGMSNGLLELFGRCNSTGERSLSMVMGGRTWAQITMMTGEDFVAMCNPNNVCGSILLAYWLATVLLLSQLENVNRHHEHRQKRWNAYAQWLERLLQRSSEDIQPLSNNVDVSSNNNRLSYDGGQRSSDNSRLSSDKTMDKFLEWPQKQLGKPKQVVFTLTAIVTKRLDPVPALDRGALEHRLRASLIYPHLCKKPAAPLTIPFLEISRQRLVRRLHSGDTKMPKGHPALGPQLFGLSYQLTWQTHSKCSYRQELLIVRAAQIDAMQGCPYALAACIVLSRGSTDQARATKDPYASSFDSSSSGFAQTTEADIELARAMGQRPPGKKQGKVWEEERTQMVRNFKEWKLAVGFVSRFMGPLQSEAARKLCDQNGRVILEESRDCCGGS